MLVTLGLLVLAAVAICRLLRSEWDRTRLLVVVAVGTGWLLLGLPGVEGLVRSGGEPVVELTRQTGYVLGPFLLLIGACWGLLRLARRCWSSWPELGASGRGAGVVGCVVVGLLVAVLLKSVPGVADATRIAEKATAAGLQAGWDAALDLFGGGDGGA